VVAKFPKALLPGRKAATGERGIALSDLAWTEAEPLLTQDRLVVLPLGAAAKEHGPHLTLGNDRILADELARRVLEARPVAMLPTLTYGFYPAFLEYPGSTSLSFDTQRDVVAQIVRSMAAYGPRRFYVLNTGVSTARPLKEASEVLAKEGVLLRYTDVLAAGRAAEESVREQPEGTHADEIETSMVLFLRPSAVRMEKAVRDGIPKRKGPLVRRPGPDGHLSPSGVYGDPTLATWRKGETVVEAYVAAILADLDALATAPVPPGQPRSPLGDGPPR
jgi:creatinine amidohydrolase